MRTIFCFEMQPPRRQPPSHFWRNTALFSCGRLTERIKHYCLTGLVVASLTGFALSFSPMSAAPAWAQESLETDRTQKISSSSSSSSSAIFSPLEEQTFAGSQLKSGTSRASSEGVAPSHQPRASEKKLFRKPGTDSNGPSNAQNSPVEIEADEALVWDREKKQYRARGNALAKQGDTILKGDLLIADYTEDEETNESAQLTQIRAQGAVELVTPDGRMQGDEAVYHMIKGIAQMTGKRLRLDSPERSVRAKDKFIYYKHSGRFEAHGAVVVEQAGNMLQADKATAFFAHKGESTVSQNQNLDRLEAEGNVIITTPEETLTGKKVMYDPDSGVAELRGNVAIQRGDNLLTGDRASVDLNTNISRIYSNPASGQKVRALLFPGKEQNPSNHN